MQGYTDTCLIGLLVVSHVAFGSCEINATLAVAAAHTNGMNAISICKIGGTAGASAANSSMLVDDFDVCTNVVRLLLAVRLCADVEGRKATPSDRVVTV